MGKMQMSKVVALLVILAGLAITQESLLLMYLCIKEGYTATAAWLTAAVGLAEGVIASGAAGYFGLAKSDHREGGITFEAAKAKNFSESSVESPPI